MYSSGIKVEYVCELYKTGDLLKSNEQKDLKKKFSHQKFGGRTQSYMRSIINLYDAEWDEIIRKAYEVVRMSTNPVDDVYDEDNDERANIV